MPIRRMMESKLRFAIAVVVLLSAFGLSTGRSVAQTDSPRHEIQTYSAPHGFDLGPTRGTWSLGVRFLRFDAKRGEKSVRFEIQDTLDIAVGGRVAIDSDGDGGFDEDHYFCGVSEKLPVHPRGEIYVGVVLGVCPDASSVTLPTHGMVTAAFFR